MALTRMRGYATSPRANSVSESAKLGLDLESWEVVLMASPTAGRAARLACATSVDLPKAMTRVVLI